MRATLFEDRQFYPAMLRIAAPIALQQFMLSALSAIDVLMVGQLGETAVAGVGLANQFYFLMSLLLFGVGSGAAVFGAQFWGTRDVANIRRVVGLGLLLSVAGASAFGLLAIFAPRLVLSVYSTDPAVIAVGSYYLRITGLSYTITAFTSLYSYLMRSTGNVRLPMAVSIGALCLKTGLSYLLIFGHLGFPILGVAGAAIATCLARYLECGVLLSITYYRRLPVAGRLHELAGFVAVSGFTRRFVRTVTPVVLGEFGWALASTTYTLIYARIGTDSIAAFNIAATMDGLALVPIIALTLAAAIMTGNRIGAGEESTASLYARKFVMLGALAGIIVGVVVAAVSGLVVSLYNVPALTQTYARLVVLVLAMAYWMKGCNFVMIAGVLRGGGDTRYAFFVDVGGAWLVGIPLAATAAFILDLPVYWVALFALGEEVVKLFLCLPRLTSRRWIHNVVQHA